MKRQILNLIGIASLALALYGCIDDAEVVHHTTNTEQQAGTTIDIFERGDVRYTFIDQKDSIGIAESAPIGSPSTLDALLLEAATSLEVFVALDPERQPPAVLIEYHNKAVGERTSPLPGNETVDIPGARNVRDLSAVVAASELLPLAAITAHYDATCSFAGDGQQYFDGRMDDLGWNWGWYWYNFSNAYEVRYSAITGNTSQVRSHSCNQDGGPPGAWQLSHVFDTLRSCGGGPWLNQYHEDVQDGYRAVYVQYSGPANCRYRNRTRHNPGQSWFSMGLMAP